MNRAAKKMAIDWFLNDGWAELHSPITMGSKWGCKLCKVKPNGDSPSEVQHKPKCAVLRFKALCTV